LYRIDAVLRSDILERKAPPDPFPRRRRGKEDPMTDIPTKAKTRSLFAGVADRYRTSADHAEAEDRNVLFSRIGLDPSQVVLDVATGGGHTAAALSPRVRRVVASDLTPEMLVAAGTLVAERALRNVVFVAADAERLPFRPAAFDRVTCRIAPHHFPDVRASLSEFARVVKPGGLIGVIDSVVPEDPALDAFLNGIEKVRDPSHVRSYRVDEWITLFKDSGLTLMYTSCSWKEHPFAEWVNRTGRPESVRREVEEMFATAFPRAREYYRIRIEGGRVLSYADEKGIFIAGKE
jgi:ubiquinone/menaquinone biosynthesis C-methylase UbiE